MIIHETVDFSNLSGAFQLGDYASQDSLQAIMSRLMQAYQPPRQPTSRALVDSLPRLPVRPLDASSEATKSCQHYASCAAGEPCSVCHENFEERLQVLELPCKHCFHEDCILPWLKEHNTCPVCRHKLEVEEGSAQIPETSEPNQATHEDQSTATDSDSSEANEGERNRSQNGAIRQYIRLSQQVDALGHQLTSLRTAAQAQVAQLLEGGNEEGGADSRTPLAELSDRLAATQRSLEAAQTRLQSLESVIQGHQSLQSIAQRVVQANRQQQQGHPDAVLDAQLLPSLARDLRALRRQQESLSTAATTVGSTSTPYAVRIQQGRAAEQDLAAARQELMTRLTADERLHQDAMSAQASQPAPSSGDSPSAVAAASHNGPGEQPPSPPEVQRTSGRSYGTEHSLSVITMEYALGPLPLDLVVQPLRVDDLPSTGPAIAALAEVPSDPLPVPVRLDDPSLQSSFETEPVITRDISRPPMIVTADHHVDSSANRSLLQLNDLVLNAVEGGPAPARTSSAGLGSLALSLAGAAAGALGSMQWLFRRS